MDVTWNWMIQLAAWVFLTGTLMVTASALPAVQKRSPRMLTTGFLLGVISFFMVILAWVLPRVPGWLF